MVPLGWTTAAHATRARKRRLRKIQHIHRVLSSSSSANMVRESRPKHRVACIVFMAGREISKGASPWTTAALIVPRRPPIPTGSAKLTSDTSQSPLPNLNKTLTPRFGTRWDVHLRPNVLELIQRRSTNGWCGRIHCSGFHSWWQHQENFLGNCMTALRFIRLQSLNHGGLIAHRCHKAQFWQLSWHCLQPVNLSPRQGLKSLCYIAGSTFFAFEACWLGCGRIGRCGITRLATFSSPVSSSAASIAFGSLLEFLHLDSERPLGFLGFSETTRSLQFG